MAKQACEAWHVTCMQITDKHMKQLIFKRIMLKVEIVLRRWLVDWNVDQLCCLLVSSSHKMLNACTCCLQSFFKELFSLETQERKTLVENLSQLNRYQMEANQDIGIALSHLENLVNKHISQLPVRIKTVFTIISQHASITIAFLANISLEEFTSIFRLNEFEFYWFECTNLENVFLHVNESKRMSSDKFVWVNYWVTSVIF